MRLLLLLTLTSPTNFNANLQAGLNFINTDDTGVSDRDVMTLDEEWKKENRALQVQQDAIVAELRRYREDEGTILEEFIKACYRY